MNQNQTSTIIIADDHPLLLKGLGDFLRARGYKVMKQIADGSQALKEIIDHEPEFAILDIEMPYLSGFEVATKLHEKNCETHIILISYQLEPAMINAARSKGVKGFILKEDAMSMIEECLDVIRNGDVYVSPTLAYKEADSLTTAFQNLTPSEKKIMKRIAGGMSSGEIASLFHISERTVEKHRSNIIKKLNLEGQFALLSWVNEHKKAILHL